MAKIFVIIIAILLAFLVYRSNIAPTLPELSAPSASPDDLPGLQTSAFPWPPENANLKNRLSLIGLPALSREGTALHTHQHLDIYINGQKIAIPSEIGINEPENVISIIHTHDTSGIIHVESPILADFTLGQFFDIWGVRFTDSCLGIYCADAQNQLSLYVNGQKQDTPYRDLKLQPLQQITLVFGSVSQVPTPLPSSYNFPPDY